MNRTLFVDEDVIESYFGAVEHTTEQPERHLGNPVLVAEHPWEGGVVLHGSFYYDRAVGKYRAWYMTMRYLDNWQELGRSMCECGSICYAESDDGVTWVKPTLGLVEFQGSRDNNIVFDTDYYIDYPSVLLDTEEDDPHQRYKMLLYCHKPGAHGNYLFTSGDGIHWSDPVRVGIVPPADTTVLFRHPRTKEYLVFSKYHSPKRVRTLSTSPDLVHFSPHQIILAPDAQDPDHSDLYFLSVERYEGNYLGLLGLYHYHPDKDSIDVQLAYSLDGYSWRRPKHRQTLITLGDEGSFDHTMIGVLANSFVVMDDKIRVYYGGFREKHEIHIADQRGAIGFFELRRDGFVSVSAGNVPGGIVTRPQELRLSDAFHVNTACEREGRIAIELLSCEDKDALPYATAYFDGDSVDHVVKWELTDKGRAALDQRKDYRLRFTMNRAKLYSFWTTPEAE